MKSNQSTERGNAHIILIVLLVVALIGALGWVAWQNLMPKDKAASSSSSQTSSKSESSNQFLEIAEWGVKLPLSSEIDDIAYRYKSEGDLSTIEITSPRLTDCDPNGYIAVITRGREGVVFYTAPDETEVSFKKGEQRQVGDFYYEFLPPQGTCSGDVDSQTMESNIVHALKEATGQIVAL